MSSTSLQGLGWLLVAALVLQVVWGVPENPWEPEIQPRIMWNRTLGGNRTEQAHAIAPSMDGGYIVGGYTRSFGAVGADAYILKIDKDGEMVWDIQYTGRIIPPNEEGTEQIFCIIPGGNDGFIAIGGTYPNGGDSDVLVLRISDEGELVWNKTFGGPSFDEGRWIVAAQDGYVLVGVTHIGGSSEQDVYFVKIDENGEKVWEKAYGHARADGVYGLVGAEDGGFIAAGFSNSFSEDRTSEGYPMYDAYLLKVDAEGDKVWEKTYGGASWDLAQAIVRSGDGGFVVAGRTMSMGAGSADVFLFKTDGEGNLLWSHTYGGSGWDGATSLVSHPDGGFVIAGRTESYVVGDADERVYVIKVDRDGNRVGEGVYGGSLADSAYGVVSSSLGGHHVLAGAAYFPRPRSSEFYVLAIEDGPWTPIPETFVLMTLLLLAARFLAKERRERCVG